MAAAGSRHTVLLTSDGRAVVYGDNYDGQGNVPPLQEGQRYVQVAAGFHHTGLLRNDGRPIVFGHNTYRQCDIFGDSLADGAAADGRRHQADDAENGEGLAHDAAGDGRGGEGDDNDGGEVCREVVQIACGDWHTVLLYADGHVGTFGGDWGGQCCLVPEHAEGDEVFVQVSAGTEHTGLLRSDGRAVVVGRNESRQCDVPLPGPGLEFTQVSCGFQHTVLLRSDGQAIGIGENKCNQIEIPKLEEGQTYVQVAAGHMHTALLRNDGTVVCCGSNWMGRCNLPEAPPGQTYVQIAAGHETTVGITSNGMAFVSGPDDAMLRDPGGKAFPGGGLAPLPSSRKVRLNRWLRQKRNWYRRLRGKPEIQAPVHNFYMRDHAEIAGQGGQVTVVQLAAADAGSLSARKRLGQDAKLTVVGRSLAGNELATVSVFGDARAADVRTKFERIPQLRMTKTAFVLPDGRTLDDCDPASPIVELLRLRL